jgi:hypothetical protein
MLLHLRAAYKRTFGRELVSVVFDQCEAQPDGVQCSLFCLRSAHLWLTNQPQLCAQGGEVERDAQLARQADIASMVRASKCSCKEFRQRRMIRCFSRLIEASAMGGLLQRLEDKPRASTWCRGASLWTVISSSRALRWPGGAAAPRQAVQTRRWSARPAHRA